MNNNNESIIIFLIEALKFYANIENYKLTENGKSLIEIDSGESAKYALKQMNELNELNKKYDEEYVKSTLKNIESENIEKQTEILNMLNKLKL